MKYKTIVDSNIIIKQLSWFETEKPKAEELYSAVSSILQSDYNFYLFSAFTYSYPTSFRIKHFGLWNSLIKKYAIKVSCFDEKNIKLSSCGVVYGVSRVHYLNREIFELLLDFNRNSWLLFTDVEYDLDFLMEDFIEKSDRHFKICYEKIIEYFCEKGEKIVFLIDGSGDSALYTIQNNT